MLHFQYRLYICSFCSCLSGQRAGPGLTHPQSGDGGRVWGCYCDRASQGVLWQPHSHPGFLLTVPLHYDGPQSVLHHLTESTLHTEGRVGQEDNSSLINSWIRQIFVLLLWLNTVNQPLFACEIYSQGSREPYYHEYFLLWTTIKHIVVIKKKTWLGLVAKNYWPKDSWFTV